MRFQDGQQPFTYKAGVNGVIKVSFCPVLAHFPLSIRLLSALTFGSVAAHFSGTFSLRQFLGQCLGDFLGACCVTQGWDQGCLGMKLGATRKLDIPADEGYGAGGFPAWGIPPNGGLLFEIEVLKIA